MCVRRHFNHKSGIWGLENSGRGDSGRDKNKPEVRSRGGAALVGGWEGKRRAGAPPALAGPLGRRWPWAATSIRGERRRLLLPSPVGDAAGEGTRSDPGRGRRAARTAASAFRSRAPPEVAPGGGCGFFIFYLEPQGSGAGEGGRCVSL